MSLTNLKNHWLRASLVQRLFVLGLLVMLPACALYAGLADEVVVAPYADEVEEPECNPLDEWVGRRLERVVMSYNESLVGVIITDVCDDFIRLETTAGGKTYLVATDSIIMLEGRPEE